MKRIWFLLFLFFVGRLGLDAVLWSQLPPYYSYGFEILLVGLAAWIFCKEFKSSLRFPLTKYVGVAALLFFAFGWITSQVMGQLGLHFPLNFRDLEIAIIAFLIAPVLEELLFRFVLWESFRKFAVPARGVIVLTAVGFSFSHFLSYFQLTDIFRQVILFQTAYTFVLGIFLGLVRSRTGSVVSSMGMHLLFNLGFAATSLIYG